jgi:uncharacterized cupredoxin-like copper-binding protein
LSEISTERSKTMKKQLIITIVAAYAVMAGLAGAQAAESVKQEPIEVIVQLGTKSGELAITPSELKLQADKLYRLVLNNPSSITHYFSVPQFGSTVRTDKIDVQGGEVIRMGVRRLPPVIRARSVATSTLSSEVSEIELRPGGMAQWTFTPLQTGSYKLGCGAPAHAQAGMEGHILVI